MLSQRQMKEWIPETIELFKSVMASNHARFPEICIVSDKTMDRIRNSLLARTQSQAKIRVEIPAMETLHGPGGDAIIIYQNAFRGAYWDEESKGSFQHFLWHELGHFYALNMEDPADNYSRFMDQKPHPDEYEALLGYSFWSEFIAEVIACKVTPAQEIDWEGYNWYPIRNELRRLLFGALNTSGMGINWYDLAFYIAKVTSRICCRLTNGILFSLNFTDNSWISYSTVMITWSIFGMSSSRLNTGRSHMKIWRL